MKPHHTFKAHLLTFLAFSIIGLVVFLPLTTVFIEAFSNGFDFYYNAISDPLTKKSLWLTIQVMLWIIPLNVLFGLCASWAIAKFHFPGRTFLLTLIDLPFSVPPVISGFIYILLFGSQTVLGSWLTSSDIHLLFSVPAIIITTLFVTFPFVARELIPLMESQGTEEEEAALILGASGLQTFFFITLPNIKWGLLYGILLSSARAMGEFGAVSVVSGHIQGLTTTLPLHIEILYNEYHFVAAFAAASLLSGFALLSLLLKRWLEHKKSIPLMPSNQTTYNED
jgi:sulfate transport system permease protein